jgi:hypothetical protein
MEGRTENKQGDGRRGRNQTKENRRRGRNQTKENRRRGRNQTKRMEGGTATKQR